MTATTNTVSFLITAKDQASGVIKTVSDNITGIGKTVQSAGGEVTAFGEKYRKTFQNMATYGGLAFTAITAGASMLATDAAKAESVAGAYDRTTKSIGLAGEELLASLQNSSKGTVNNTDLMLSANKAILLGVADDTEEFTTLMDIARNRGQAMGIDLTQAFGDIVTGLGRASPMILDNLGITVKIGEVNENYAKSIGKTVDQLTEQEKKTALINAVVSQGKKELAEQGEIAMTNAERVAKMNVQWENTKIALGTALIPVLTKVTETFTPIIETIGRRAEENPKLFSTVVVVAGAVAGLIGVLGTLGLMLPAIGTGITAVGTALTIATSPIGLFVAAVAVMAYLVIKYRDDIKAFVDKTTKNIALFLLNLRERILEIQNGIIKDIAEWILQRTLKMIQLKDDLFRLIGETWNNIVTGIQTGITNAINKFKNFVSMVKDVFTGLASQAVQRGANLLDMFYNGIMSKVSKITDAVRNVADQVKGYLGFSSPTEKGPGSNADRWMPNLIDMMVDGLNAGAGKIASTAQGIAGAISGPLSSTSTTLPSGSSVAMGSSFGGGYGGRQIVIQGNTFYGSDPAFVDKIGDELMKKVKMDTSFASY